MAAAAKLLEEAAERRDKIAKLHRQGVEREFIAKRVGLTRDTVTVILRELRQAGVISKTD